MATPTDPERLAQQLVTDATPEQHRALVDALLTGRVSSIFGTMQVAEPALHPAPAEACSFRVRLDLRETTPSI